MANKKKIVVVFLLSVAAVLAAGMGAYLFGTRSQVTTDDAYIEGRIHSIASKVPATAAKVYVDDNQAVRRGELLVELDPADYDLRANEAEAAVETGKARLLDAEAGIKAAEANLKIQQVALIQAERDNKRAEALYKEEVITREKQEKAATAFHLTAAQVKAAEEQLARAKTARGLEEAVIKQTEAAAQLARRNLSYTRIVSPSSGYVTRRSVEAGNQIQAGQPLMAVVALDDIWVLANYKETQLKNVRPGQKVRITVDTYPGKTFSGRVDSIMAGTGAAFSLFPPENALGNYVKVVQRIPVKIVFDKTTDDTQGLRIGMSCVPTITTGDE